MPKVSIIVPVYNAENTLKRCIESILNQEYTNFELLLIDDGSKDLSGNICDEYAAKDDRVKVIHKENTGVSDSRNCGIEAARGDFLQFVDADDWLTADATKLMLRAAEDNNCELVISDFYRVVGKKVSHKGSIKEEGVITKEELAEYMMDNPADFYYGVLWNKLFKRNIIFEKQIRMDETVSWCEDFLFNLEYIQYAEKVCVLSVPVYYYVKTEGSLVSQSMNMAHIVRTKFHVFEYYNNFYKNIYTEKDYQKKRLGLYRYLIDVADDGIIIPGLFTTKKLGEERVPVLEYAVDGNGYLTEHYRNAKLMERYFQTIGLRYDLTLNDIKVFAHLCQIRVIRNKKELADYAGISQSSVSRILQKLARRKMIEVSAHKDCIDINVLEEGEPILKELQNAFMDYDYVRFQGFSDNERSQYHYYQNKIKENLNRVLK